MRFIEAIPGQGVFSTQASRPEVEILASQLARHDKLVELNPTLEDEIGAVSPLSFGLFAGATIARATSRNTAFRLVAMRADIVREAESKKTEDERSAMGIILASRDTISGVLSRFPTLHWTNDNGPGAHVLGGPIKELRQLADEVGRRFRGFLTAEGAYHSTLRQDDAKLFRERIEELPIRDPEIPIISSTGTIKEILTAEELKNEMAESMVRPVKLEEIVAYWRQKGYEAVFDISSGGTIQQLVTRFQTGLNFSSLEEEVEKIKDFFASIKSQVPNPNMA